MPRVLMHGTLIGLLAMAAATPAYGDEIGELEYVFIHKHDFKFSTLVNIVARLLAEEPFDLGTRLTPATEPVRIRAERKGEKSAIVGKFREWVQLTVLATTDGAGQPLADGSIPRMTRMLFEFTVSITLNNGPAAQYRPATAAQISDYRERIADIVAHALGKTGPLPENDNAFHCG